MASISGNSTTVNFFTFLLILLLADVATNVNAVSVEELESMLAAVRVRGYNLFANAISTSDIHYELISGNAFTLFAPINSSLFALDMTTTASDYVTTLRCHVVTRRLSLDDLHRQPSRSSIPTLLKGREAVIESLMASGTILVDGIRVAVPGLFYGQNLAVHGLGGIISSRSTAGSRQRSSPMINPPPSSGGVQSSNHAPPPPQARSSMMSNPPQNFTGNHASPMSHPPPQNFAGNQVLPPPVRSSPMSHPPHNFTATHSPVQMPPPPVRPSPMFNPPPDLTSIHNSSNTSPPPTIFSGNGWMNNNNNAAASEPAVSEVFPQSPEKSPSINQSPVIGNASQKPNDISSSRALLSELTSPITYDSLAGEFSYTSESMAKSQPLDEKTFDCPLTDGKTGPVDHGYLYTRQHYNVPKMSCRQTYQDTL